jgi:flagellar motor switch protein FliG
LSELVDIEDLGLLDGGDLRAVLEQVPERQVVEALIGAPAALRHLLLAKLPPDSAAALDTRVRGHGPVPFETVQAAQRAVVEALRRLSRAGQIAFDDPEDMVA